MLRRYSSRTPFLGVLTEHECPRCRRTAKLPIGEICRECRQEIDRRASRIGRLVAAVTTLGMGIYILLRMPEDRTARTVGVMAIVIWYVLTNLIVKRVLREHLK